ncbi:MAG: T9SS type A sorting domain-containing protein [Candidatus Cloacimonadota bacterium]|nr:MAG: T9SS type A sorting domain-containing protein [Candidatus Cloacimonadota bacterium]
MKNLLCIIVMLLIWVQSLLADSWTTKADMLTERYALAIGVVNNKIYAIGGWNGFLVPAYRDDNEEYDPLTNSWTTKADMPKARQALAIGVVDNKIYAIGGTDGGGSYLDTNEIYNPSLNSWTTGASMPTARYAFAIGVVNDKIYAIGGSNGSLLDTNEEYDPSMDTWESKTSMTTPRYGLVAGVVASKIYAIGGKDLSANLVTNEEYDPSSNSWTSKEGMTTARWVLAEGVIQGKLYAIGGWGSSSYHDTNEEYDPSSNSWATKAPMPTGRRLLAIGEVGDKLYAIGGAGSAGLLKTNEEYTPDITGVESPSFYAIAGNFCVHLCWSVEIEDNCLLYIILKKSTMEDDDYFEIARIPGSGSSPSPKTYFYRDEDVEVGIRYYYKLGVVRTNGDTQWYGPVSAVVTGVRGYLKVSPNPFAISTTISFTRIGQSAEGIELKIYDMSGRLVKNLSLGTRHLALGTDVTWDGRDGNGNLLPSGIYLCTLELGGIRKTEKILLVR